MINLPDSWEIREGDCLDRLAELPDNSIDAVVTDPPAGISFMAHAWDDDRGGRDEWVTWMTSVMRECLRVLKPGGHALVWSIPRTSHWTGWAIESAGFEPRDVVAHVFGSGMPKNHDVSKAIDRRAGAEREVIGYRRGVEVEDHQGYGGTARGAVGIKQQDALVPVTAPATAEAEKWEGWGTALKPAVELWILARKPVDGSVANSVVEHGTGALNIDGTRVPYSDDEPDSGANYYRTRGLPMPENRWSMYGGKQGTVQTEHSDLGRWPANVTMDEHVAEVLGSAARFFYVAKPDQAERDAGTSEGNPHHTVKAVALCRWLCRLVTPPGGLVLDPFSGSGSVGVGAILEGFRYLGFELSPEYAATARERIEFAEQATAEGYVGSWPDVVRAKTAADKKVGDGQMTLL